MFTGNHLSMQELENGLDGIRRSPQDGGVLKLIVRRPAEGQREVLERGELSLDDGLVGDYWKAQASRHASDGNLDLSNQITVMNARAVNLLAQDGARWPLAGDQLYVDLDLSVENLPSGAQIAIGTAVIEVTATPHTGCDLFMERFGKDAVLFVNSPAGKKMRLRGLNARVVKPGVVHTGDKVHKLATPISHP